MRGTSIKSRCHLSYIFTSCNVLISSFSFQFFVSIETECRFINPPISKNTIGSALPLSELLINAFVQYTIYIVGCRNTVWCYVIKFSSVLQRDYLLVHAFKFCSLYGVLSPDPRTRLRVMFSSLGPYSQNLFACL